MWGVQPPHVVNLSTPDKTIIVQLIKSFCAMSVVDEYKQLGKFNFRELSLGEEDKAGALQKTGTEMQSVPGEASEEPSAPAPADAEPEDSTQAVVQEGSNASRGEVTDGEGVQSPPEPVPTVENG